ncbi:S8 family serine peptidase [Rheinheimera sp.]|uniref:S8 family serine peptidase n=1 Tax=Rheinheimera sp. TaxID=1869214 RepID=UPI002733832A|nr:S8 family serine peptidase [Rheinheimera sp.]MDP2714240.1 S8 family serine peptidase [Rheinheimera sp.]
MQRVQQLKLEIASAQQQVSTKLFELDTQAQVLTKTKHLAAAIVVKADDGALQELKKHPLVKQILPVYDSKPLVVESQQYINASPIVSDGIATGNGIRVAILDTGIDYTHVALGGAGTEQAYANAMSNQGNVSWPQGKVVGGFDFINNDPNPIDPSDEGHGTAVANSVNGIAPDVSFYGYKVCAPAPVLCTGLAQINALEAAMDPNGDGDLSDRVDVINMSLGGDFGSTDTSSGTQLLIQRAVELGVSMVVSAGNDGPNPFIVGGPSTTPNALSVGAMTHPTAASAVLRNSRIAGEDVEIIAAGFNPVSVFSFTNITTPLLYIAENGEACDAFADDIDFTGKAVLVDRGSCNFTQKVLNAQAKGAEFVIIANNAAEAGAVSAGGAADGLEIPAVGISMEVGDLIKAALLEDGVVEYSISSESLVTAGAIADFTSRGPAVDGLLKPEITAPGVAIMVASAGAGDGLAPASGTSFSGPITAGAVSLLREARPELNAFEAKAILMNTANLDVTALPRSIQADAPLAPISSIGAGLVDVQKAIAAPAVAWVYDATFDTKQAALSFGLQTLTESTQLTKTVTLKNFSAQARTYALALQDRFSNDTSSGALNWDMPQTVEVGAGQTVQFDVTLTIDPTKLHKWQLANGGVAAEKNDILTLLEYDGAIVLNDSATDAESDLHLVYHILPKANADLKIRSDITEEGIQYVVRNDGAIAAQPFAAQLVATSAKDDVAHDIRAVTLDVLDISTDYCASGYMLAAGFRLDKPLSHMPQASFSVILDINSDDAWDYEINSLLLSRLGSYADNPAFTGYVGSFITAYDTLNGAVGDAIHVSGQRNVTLTSCLDDVGLTKADLGKSIKIAYATFNDGSAIGVNWGSPIDDLIVTSTALSLAPEVLITDVEGKAIDSLAPGETAKLSWDNVGGNGFVLLSESGDGVAVANLTQGDQAPVVLSEQVISVEEHTATGTIIGKVDAEVDFSSPVSEFVLVASSSNTVAVLSNGDVVVSNSGLLDYDAGLTEIQLEVIALDTDGNISAPELVRVQVVNIADEAPEVSLTMNHTKVDVGTAIGKEIGTVAVVVKEADAELSGVQTSSDLFTVQGDKLVLSRVPTKADAKIHSVVVTATDTSGMTGSATVSITVNKPSGGSFGWFSLFMLPLLLLRRKRA